VSAQAHDATEPRSDAHAVPRARRRLAGIDIALGALLAVLALTLGPGLGPVGLLALALLAPCLLAASLRGARRLAARTVARQSLSRWR
jgi:hypothetical protein